MAEEVAVIEDSFIIRVAVMESNSHGAPIPLSIRARFWLPSSLRRQDATAGSCGQSPQVIDAAAANSACDDMLGK